MLTHTARFPLTFSTLALAVLLSACSSTPKPDAGGAASRGVGAGQAESSALREGGSSQGVSAGAGAASALPGDASAATSRAAAAETPAESSVYFEFDDYSVSNTYLPLLERNGGLLAGNTAMRMTVEGHADERGSREYNLALGNKRAQAVVRILKLQGARDAQLEAVSWGEDKPRAEGHDEAAWAQNRRADLVAR